MWFQLGFQRKGSIRYPDTTIGIPLQYTASHRLRERQNEGVLPSQSVITCSPKEAPTTVSSPQETKKPYIKKPYISLPTSGHIRFVCGKPLTRNSP